MEKWLEGEIEFLQAWVNGLRWVLEHGREVSKGGARTDFIEGALRMAGAALDKLRRRTVAVGELEIHSVLGEPLMFLNTGEDTLISLMQIADETSGKHIRIILEEE